MEEKLILTTYFPCLIQLVISSIQVARSKAKNASFSDFLLVYILQLNKDVNTYEKNTFYILSNI